MRLATQVQFQYDEDSPKCDAHAFGRFFKWSRCATMALNYSRQHDIKYHTFFLFRPDQRWYHYFKTDFLNAQPFRSNVQWALAWCHGEFV